MRELGPFLFRSREAVRLEPQRSGPPAGNSAPAVTARPPDRVGSGAFVALRSPRPTFPLKALAIGMCQSEEGRILGIDFRDVIKRRPNDHVDGAGGWLLDCLSDQGESIQKFTNVG